MQTEVLRPACHGLQTGVKQTKHVNFSNEKKLFGSIEPKILEKLTTQRPLLSVECPDFKRVKDLSTRPINVGYNVDKHYDYTTEYLSLLLGFIQEQSNDPPTTETDELLPKEKKINTQPFTCCEWLDISTFTTVFSLNAHHEYAHALFASGCVCLERASQLIEILLRSRDFEYDEPKLKEAYNILLRTAGLFDALLSWLGISSTKESTELNDESLKNWRAEQTRAGDNEIQSIMRTKDFENGTMVQFLSGVSLTQAQELVLLRGVTRENVDWILMGKLAIDISKRYSELVAPSKFENWKSWKCTYYESISVYYQGVAEWIKSDGSSCAQAIAQYQSAMETLSQVTVPQVERSKNIIKRDLDIAVSRNNSVYHEKVPEPLTLLDRATLVQAIQFPPVVRHGLWDEDNMVEIPQSNTNNNVPKSVPMVDQSSGGCSCTIS